MSVQRPASEAVPARKTKLPRPDLQLLGRTLGGRYHVHAVLGSGGMGTVYAATDAVTKEEVAIKGLNAKAYSAVNLRRLRREANASLAAADPHLCNVYHLGVERGTPFLVMERLFGETLRSRIRREGPLPAADAIAIMLQILDGLSAAHAAGVLHRDVKPSNVFVISPPGQPPKIKLIDFGLAKPMPSSGLRSATRTHREDESQITTTDLIPGTPQYLTPEQLLGERNLDARVDVWAAALTFFEMLTGRRVFPVAWAYEILISRIMLGPVPAVSALRPDLPAELDAVMATALAKDRECRYASAAAFRTALVEVWSRHRALAIARGVLLKRAPGSLVMMPPRVIVSPPPEDEDLMVEMEIVPESSTS